MLFNYLLLTVMRFSNTFTKTKSTGAFKETLGWWSLIFSKRKLNL
ncbi:hypothetical protein J2W95_003146 [Flavobacterium granuli]|uniref:Uncharacterized protein n=1 Tax=Flavobacterium granuli TaxID=280093 RepID=A0ABU1S5W1_9FLAO|nr:hypothetical protein [Flavobacterium granuli]